MNNKEIRFIDSNYNELFKIPDGGNIVITRSNGEQSTHKCKYLDSHHTEIGNYCYHICEFAEKMENIGSTYTPAPTPEYLLEHISDVDRSKFFKTDNGFTEVYYNPNSDAGGQLVYNEISNELIKDAAANSKTKEDFFEYLDDGCKQHLIDINTPEFKENLNSFMNRKADFEDRNEKTMQKLKKHAGVRQEKNHKEKDFER